jgi:hypothetical protein
MAENHTKRATVHEKRSDITQALAELRKARSIMAALVSTAPGNEKWTRDLAEIDENIARIAAKARG